MILTTKCLLTPTRRYWRLRHFRLFSGSVYRGNLALKEFPVPPDRMRLHLQQKYQAKFINSNLTPQSSIDTTNIHDIIQQHSYKADNYKDICEVNNNQPPIVGSIIEYVNDDELQLGFVLRPAISKFNENYNKIIVLDIKNNLHEIDTARIRLHFHGIFDNEWVELLTILENRHNPDFSARYTIIDILKTFLNESIKLRKVVEPNLEVVYAQNSSSRLNSVSLDSVLELIETPASSYFQQSCMIMACHKLMVDDPYHWMVPNTLPNPQSNISQGYSNNLVPSIQYFTLPVMLMEYLCEYDNLDADEKEFFITDLQKQQAGNRRSLQDLHLYFSLWEGRKYRSIIELMKYVIIYPHPVLVNKLLSLSVLTNFGPQQVYEYLVKIGIYEASTDIYLSCGLLGQSVISDKISISKAEEIKPKIHGNINPKDNFRHLRGKSYDAYDLVYAIKLDHSWIGVSLQMINSRIYNVAVHIPDLSTKLTPKSHIMKQLLNDTTTNLTTTINQSQVKMFNSSNYHWLGFHEQFMESEFLSASEIYQGYKGPESKQTCLTIGFKYHTTDANGFKECLQKTTISLNSLARVKIKKLTDAELAQCLEGRPSLSFGLFSTKVSRITNEDYHNIGFIYNVLKTHFSVRNLNGAVNYSPQHSRIGFFKKEIEEFVSHLVSLYATEHSIPLIKHHQSLVEHETVDTEIDQALVHHNNILLPKFHANTFFQTLISRDSNGNVSLSAYLIGNNYLTRPEIGLTNARDFPSANDHGKVHLLKPFESFESLINQYQLIHELNEQYATYRSMKLDEDFDKSQKFAHIKGQGYNVNGPSLPIVMTKYLPAIKNSAIVNDYIQNRSTRIFKLRHVETQLQQNQMIDFECVVTHMGESFNNGKLCKVYVAPLGIEVDMFTQRQDLSIGSVTRANEVLLLQPIRGVCVLNEDIY